MNISRISQRSWLGRVLRAPLNLIPRNAVVPVLQGKLRGHKWVVGSSIHGCWLGSYEYEKQIRFEQTIRRGDIVFDIGAHVGFYTLLASKLVGPEGQVFAFEPLPRNIDYLHRHLRLNHVRNVTVIEAAVMDQQGTVSFAPGNDSSSGRVTADGEFIFKAVALDALIQRGELPLPSVMKIDIEGAEALAMMGGHNMLAQAHPTIFLATHGQEAHNASCDILQTLGYQLEPLESADLVNNDELIASYHA